MTIRTSDTDRLRIDELAVSNVPGLIGLTFCPGKAGWASLMGGVWRRDLEKDHGTIRSWGASVVVTLMEDHELRECKVQHLGQRVKAHRMNWKHLPIVDAGVPDTRFETQWKDVVPEFCGRLRAGERIVLHCRGGFGRTGLAGACLLIEFSVEAEAAMHQVRQARPGCIERFQQEEYVRRYQPLMSRQAHEPL